VIASPFTAPEKWGTITVGGIAIPGHLVSVDGLSRPYEWAVQMGLGLGGAATLFRTSKLIESAKVVIAVPDEDSWQALLTFMPILIPGWPNNVKVKPPAFAVEHPMFAWVGLKQAALKSFDAPKDISGKFNYVQGLEFIEYSKAIQIKTGPPEPAKLNGPPKPKDFLDQVLANALAEFKAP
jgi:hypothetical protein